MHSIVACLLLAGSAVALPAPLKRDVASDRADAVKASFLHAWNGYQQYAFPNDELHPVSHGFGNSR